MQPEENVLDIGCGSGWLVRLIASYVNEGRVVGIDISDEMIRAARRATADLPNVFCAVGSAEEIPWQPHFFSRVVSVESAYYWPDPAEGLREIFRVTAEGGSAWILINFITKTIRATAISGAAVARNTRKITFRRRLVHAISRRSFHQHSSRTRPRPNAKSRRIQSPLVPRRAAQLAAFRRRRRVLIRGMKTRPR